MPPTLKSSEPIPGYVVQERIGVGGYGEVWSAQAPGGLTKAIKFVYGYFDDARAARELKALERIKQVRHPFLLSLERFEIVDGQLIIVTELADKSLKDRYEELRAEGLEGIGRDELLNYMRDAADALDYMSENFSLQHLDVKPENLLLVGGRVKVADFGLVKNVHEVSASMMGGLTPIYAAPEVFDDRPSRFSDQYSLAIVYQEMLTGNLPFPGRTPAQLAAQHLHASPRLATLPPADQLIVAQALSKNPVERFGNSRALVDALVGADRATRGGTAAAKPARPEVSPSADTASVKSQAAKTDTDSRTQILGAEGAAAAAAFSPLAPPVEPIVNLPPIEVTDPASEKLRPTLFVGIGGTAARALRRLRRRLNDRFGGTDIPAIQMLLVDTDSKSLFPAAVGAREVPLADGDALALPLRSAHDYTADSRQMLQWLSRRWLYNIPRSLQTEGRRPLGRLALVDHAAELTGRLRAALEKMTSPESLAASAAATGLEVAGDAPRVFVVASISGGTGGGMALDVSFAVRELLTELKLPTDGVCEIFTHSTDRNPAAAELATANAYAFFTELQHYVRFGYSAGDQSRGLSTATVPRGALANTYFVHLGHGLNDHEFDAATDALAAYLYLSSATKAAAVLDQCRASAAGDAADEAGAALRSFALATIGSTHGPLPALAAEWLCREVVDHWRGKDRADAAAKASLLDIATRRPAAPATARGDVAQSVNEHAVGLGIALTPLRAKITEILEDQLGGDAAAVLAQLRAKIDAAHPSPARRGVLLAAAIRGLLDPTAVSDEVQVPPAVELWAALEAAMKPLAAPKARAIGEWILKFVDHPAARVAGAVEARQAYAEYLAGLEAQCAQALAGIHKDVQSLEKILRDTCRTAPVPGRLFGARRAESKYTAEVDRELEVMLQLHVESCTWQAVNKCLRLLACGVSTAGDALKEMQHELGQWSHAFEGPSPWERDDEDSQGGDIARDVQTFVAAALKARFAELARGVDERCEAQVLAPRGGLRGVCDKADALRAGVLEALRAAARSAVLGALEQIAIDQAVLGSESSGHGDRLQSCLEAAKTKFTDCGGGQRLLAILPTQCAAGGLAEALVRQLDPPATVAASNDADLVFCYEQQDLSLAHVAARLIDGRGDIIQIASRLHTRVDVPWSQLPQPGVRAALESPAACQ
jgi:hypothetical protein